MSYDGTPPAGCMALARRQRGAAVGAGCTWTEEQIRGERRAEDVRNWYGGEMSSDPDASVRSHRIRNSDARAHRAETDECCWPLYQRSGTIPSNPSARPLNRSVIPVIYSRESGSLVVIPPGPLPVPCCRLPTHRCRGARARKPAKSPITGGLGRQYTACKMVCQSGQFGALPQASLAPVRPKPPSKTRPRPSRSSRAR